MPKTKITPVIIPDDVLAMIDQARARLGFTRSQFIRYAIVTVCADNGITLPAAEVGGPAYQKDEENG